MFLCPSDCLFCLFVCLFSGRLTYFEEVTRLIELASSLNDDRPVVLVSHSMGSPFAQAFLNAASPEWKKTYIRALISVEGAWTGAAKAAKTIMFGANFGAPVSPGDMEVMEKSFESSAYLLPIHELWPEEDRLLVTLEKPPRNYTTLDYVQLLSDMGVSYAEERLAFVRERQLKLGPPGVETFCVYGYGRNTAKRYIYESLDSDKPKEVVYGDGDGTVSIDGLLFCEKWRDYQEEPITVKGFKGLEHLQAMKSEDVFKYIAEVLASLG